MTFSQGYGPINLNYDPRTPSPYGKASDQDSEREKGDTPEEKRRRNGIALDLKVISFSDLVREHLETMQDAGGWGAINLEYLMQRMAYEAQGMGMSVGLQAQTTTPDLVARDCALVAAYALMVADKCAAFAAINYDVIKAEMDRRDGLRGEVAPTEGRKSGR